MRRGPQPLTWTAFCVARPPRVTYWRAEDYLGRHIGHVWSPRYGHWLTSYYEYPQVPSGEWLFSKEAAQAQLEIVYKASRWPVGPVKSGRITEEMREQIRSELLIAGLTGIRRAKALRHIEKILEDG